MKVFDSAPRAGRHHLPPHCISVCFYREPARSNVSTTSVNYSKLVCGCGRRPPSSCEDGGECLVALAEAILKSKWRNKDEDMVTKLIKVFAISCHGPVAVECQGPSGLGYVEDLYPGDLCNLSRGPISCEAIAPSEKPFRDAGLSFPAPSCLEHSWRCLASLGDVLMLQALSKHRLAVYILGLCTREKSHRRHMRRPSQITYPRPVSVAIFGYLY